jgi:hypothetical protein
MLGCEAVQFLPLELSDLLTLRDGIGHRLPVHFREFGLRVEGLEVSHSSSHVEPNDSLGSRRVVERIDDPSRCHGTSAVIGQRVFGKEGPERHGANADTRPS